MRVLVAVLAGATAGAVVHLLTRLSGPVLFVSVGALAGLTSGLLIVGQRRAVRLTEITVSVPQLGKLKFAVTAESQQVAWRLFVELATRVSTQQLPPGGARIRSALTSLHSLLAFIRDLLKENPPSRRTGAEPTVEQLAIVMLNNELRPFLTHWHHSLVEWQKQNPTLDEEQWPLNEQCRAELLRVQGNLREYVLTFGELAAVPNAQEIISGSPALRARPVAAPASITSDG